MISDEYIRIHIKGLKLGLELGCGYGDFMIKLLEEGYSVYGIDKCGYCIEYANRVFKERGFDKLCYKMSAESLLFSDAYFDFVYTIISLHEMSVKNAIKEVYRVLKRGGIFIDIDWAPWADTGVPERYLRIEELMEFLADTGFKMREAFYRDDLEYVLCKKT